MDYLHPSSVVFPCHITSAFCWVWFLFLGLFDSSFPPRTAVYSFSDYSLRNICRQAVALLYISMTLNLLVFLTRFIANTRIKKGKVVFHSDLSNNRLKHTLPLQLPRFDLKCMKQTCAKVPPHFQPLIRCGWITFHFSCSVSR